ncbi:MAG: hypothetical protein IPN07_16845 [Dehalococcoidia bacterium]|nr:hypothetical protein [Dehalococcoidia bacterium]
MTLVVGLIAKDGIIIASDSQATFETGGQSTRGSSRKVTVARDVFAFGMSSMGSSTKQLIEDALTSRNDWHTKATASALRDQLGQDVNAVLKAQTERSWNAMRQPGPVIGLIAGVYANGEPPLRNQR